MLTQHRSYTRYPLTIPYSFPTSEPSFTCKNSLRWPLYDKKRIWKQNIMSEIITIPAPLRSSDDGLLVIEKAGNQSDGFSQLDAHRTSSTWEYTANRWSKWLIAASLAAVILWKRDAEASWAAMGSVVNFLLSVALKHIVNQERPISTLISGPGMPSSHAQIAFFAVVYVSLSMVKSLGLNISTMVFGMLALASGSYIAWLRVSQKYHTSGQVFVGAITGTTFSILWFRAWYAFVLKAFISSSWIREVVFLGSAMFWVSILASFAKYTFVALKKG